MSPCAGFGVDPILRIEGEDMAKVSSPALTRLEALLAARKLDATLARPDAVRLPGLLPTGVASLDDALGGGWRRGEISELIGDPSSGRTAARSRN
jgi:RecA/RadA recombinase